MGSYPAERRVMEYLIMNKYLKEGVTSWEITESAHRQYQEEIKNAKGEG